MKLIIALIAFFPYYVCGQAKIKGIGKFKINETSMAYIDTLIKEEDLSLLKINSSLEVYKLNGRENKIAELYADSINSYNSPSYSHRCNRVKVYYIPTLTISKIKVENLYLTFWDNVLTKIHTDYSGEIVDAFKIKYGDPETDKKTREEKCTLKYSGSSMSYEEPMYYQTWKNDNITCNTAIGYYRTSDCEKKVLSYIDISLNDNRTEIDNCDKVFVDKDKKKKALSKKQELEDF